MNILDYVVDKLCRAIYGYRIVIAKLQKFVFSLNHNRLFKKILNKNESIMDLCGNRKKISNHGLKLEPILTLLKRFRR